MRDAKDDDIVGAPPCGAAKIMDGDELFPSEEGTPQAGVISPLLANYVIEEPCEVESLTHGSADEAFGRPDVLV